MWAFPHLDVISLLTICTTYQQQVDVLISEASKHDPMYVWVWIWNLLFWAIVLLTYIISPHGEVYLLENCVMLFTQYDALHCFGLFELLMLRRKLRCQLKLLKKVWIYSNNNLVWCLFLWTLSLLTCSRSDVMSVYIDFRAMAWRLFVLVYKQESIGSQFCKFLFIQLSSLKLSHWYLVHGKWIN